MDKILEKGSKFGMSKTSVTNDGATILRGLPVDNPAAKVLVDTSRTQDTDVGDGTTSVVVFAGELLREADKLLQQKIHPQIIIAGYRKALAVARETLVKSAVSHEDEKQFREDLINIASTTLSSKIVQADKRKFAELCVDAVLRVRKMPHLDLIQLLKIQGGLLRDSYLEPGLLLNEKFGSYQARVYEKANIMVANCPMDNDKIKIYGAKVKTDSIEQVAAIEEAEKKKMFNKVQKIISYKPNIFINRQLIYPYPESLFAAAGVGSIDHADFEGAERLAFVLGAEITAQFDYAPQLGYAERVDEVMIGEEKVIRFSGCKRGEACTIVVRGSSSHILDEAERSLHDALCVLIATLKDRRTVLGGGASESMMAQAVDELATKTLGKESLAIESFARALRQLPTALAENGGFDACDLVSQLRSLHAQGKHTMGLDMKQGCVGDMQELKITEALRVKEAFVVSAHEAAEMILRVDDIIRAAPRKRRGPR